MSINLSRVHSDKKTAIETALAPPQGGKMGGDHKGMLTTKLAELVTAGTITADQETAIEAAITPSK